VAGVAGGLGEQLGVDGVLVRLAFVVLSCAGGVGLAAYLVAWGLGRENVDRTLRRAAPRQFVALAMILAGLLLILREMGLWFGDGLFLSVALAAAGSAVIWTRNNDRSIQSRGRSPREGRHGLRMPPKTPRCFGSSWACRSSSRGWPPSWPRIAR
jgi:phage shock protein PspC (stress-responsive transcriptional regulator)